MRVQCYTDTAVCCLRTVLCCGAVRALHCAVARSAAVYALTSCGMCYIMRNVGTAQRRVLHNINTVLHSTAQHDTLRIYGCCATETGTTQQHRQLMPVLMLYRQCQHPTLIFLLMSYPPAIVLARSHDLPT